MEAVSANTLISGNEFQASLYFAAGVAEELGVVDWRIWDAAEKLDIKL